MNADTASAAGDNKSLDGMIRIILLGLVAGGLFAALAALSGSPFPDGTAAAFGVSGLLMLAAFAGGAFFGFLFGVPRAIARGLTGSRAATTDAVATETAAAPPEPAAPQAERRARVLESNTNLERISDWLTTLLVGAGLAELHNLNDALLAFRDFLADNATVFTGPDGRPSAGILPAIGPIVVILGTSCGFLFMYLKTRLGLAREFDSVERLLAREDRLPPDQQKAVKAEARAAESFVANQLENAKSVTITDALGLMFDLLYKDSPDAVIKIGASLGNTNAVERAEYWFYLAAAFGQKLKKLVANSPEWDAVRGDALSCARKAVRINSAFKARLRQIAIPNTIDDDLSDLAQDPEFLRIVS